jgi:Mn2+/Fe2+ NRAMP family transporter
VAAVGMGFGSFVSLGIACFGAALESGLDQAYVVAQAFGWNWGENQRPAEDARFSITYTVFIFTASLLMVAGIDPLTLTIFSMALTAVVLPLVILPFLVLMNDEKYLGGVCLEGGPAFARGAAREEGDCELCALKPAHQTSIV